MVTRAVPDVDGLLVFADIFFDLFTQNAGDGPDAHVLGEMNRRQLEAARGRFKARIRYLRGENPDALRRWAEHLIRALGSVTPSRPRSPEPFPFEEDR